MLCKECTRWKFIKLGRGLCQDLGKETHKSDTCIKPVVSLSNPVEKPKENLIVNNKTELLDAKTLGKRLRLSRRQIYQLIYDKKIPAPLRIGGVWRWSEAQITDWIAAGAPRFISRGITTIGQQF